MNKQIDKLMALAHAIAMAARNGNAFKESAALRSAIEAALKPGEPVAWRLWDDEPGGVPAWRYYDQSDFCIGVNPHDFFDSLVPLYTAAPPAQTPPRLMGGVDLLKFTPHSLQHITDGALISFARAIETEVRRQFGVQE